MRNELISDKKRITALVIAFAMAFALAFSAFYIVHNSEHKCSGDDCYICARISNCVNKLNNNTPKPETAELFAAVLFAVVLLLGAVELVKNRKSLTELKVKLSN